MDMEEEMHRRLRVNIRSKKWTFLFYFCFVELGVPLTGILRRWLYMVCNTSVKGYY
jgi:hypothetical protein